MKTSDIDAKSLHRTKSESIWQLLAELPKAKAFAVEVMGSAAHAEGLATWLGTLDSRQTAPYSLQIFTVPRHDYFVRYSGEVGSMAPTASTHGWPVNYALNSLPRGENLRRLDLGGVHILQDYHEMLLFSFAEMRGLQELRFHNSSIDDPNAMMMSPPATLSGFRLPPTLVRLAISFRQDRFGGHSLDAWLQQLESIGEAMSLLPKLRYFAAFDGGGPRSQARVSRSLTPYLAKCAALVDLDLHAPAAEPASDLPASIDLQRLLVSSATLRRANVSPQDLEAATNALFERPYGQQLSVYARRSPALGTEPQVAARTFVPGTDARPPRLRCATGGNELLQWTQF